MEKQSVFRPSLLIAFDNDCLWILIFPNSQYWGSPWPVLVWYIRFKLGPEWTSIRCMPVMTQLWMAGVNQQPPLHQLRMRPLEPFWGWTKTTSSLPKYIYIFPSLLCPKTFFSYLPPTYLLPPTSYLPPPSYLPPTSPLLPPISYLRSASPKCRLEREWSGSPSPSPRREHQSWSGSGSETDHQRRTHFQASW